jgi:hypothetical protein
MDIRTNNTLPFGIHDWDHGVIQSCIEHNKNDQDWLRYPMHIERRQTDTNKYSNSPFTHQSTLPPQNIKEPCISTSLKSNHNLLYDKLSRTSCLRLNPDASSAITSGRELPATLKCLSRSPKSEATLIRL